MHGIAINIDPDLTAFDLIHPCGLVGVRMTSLADLSGRAPWLFEVAYEYAAVFGALFASSISHAAMSQAETVPVLRATSDYRPGGA